ncbi:unnamed protein product [Boreogadus saida]
MALRGSSGLITGTGTRLNGVGRSRAGTVSQTAEPEAQSMCACGEESRASWESEPKTGSDNFSRKTSMDVEDVETGET